MNVRFKLGDGIWIASWSTTQDSVECPDCGGTGRLRVTFHDNTTVSVECRNCQRGYDPPSGRIRVFNRAPDATFGYVTGFEMRDGTIEWHTTAGRYADDAKVFATEAEAIDHARAMCAEADEGERAKIAAKEKDTRSWAWNASYHRREIERAQKSIAYHESKLAVASLKAKAERAAR